MANQNGDIFSGIGNLVGQGIQATGNIAGNVGDFLQKNPDIFKGLLIGGAGSLAGLSGEKAISAGILGTLGAGQQRERRSIQMRQLLAKNKNELYQKILDVQGQGKGKLSTNFTKEFLADLPSSAFFKLGIGENSVTMVKTPKAMGEFAGKLGNLVESRNSYEQIIKGFKNGDISLNQIRIASGLKLPPGNKYSGEVQRIRSSFHLMDEAISRMLTGAAKPEQEKIDFRRLYAPALTDTNETMIWKLERAARIAKRIENSISYGDATLKEEEGKFRLDANSATNIMNNELNDKENQAKLKEFKETGFEAGSKKGVGDTSKNNAIMKPYLNSKNEPVLDSTGEPLFEGFVYIGQKPGTVADRQDRKNWKFKGHFTKAQSVSFNDARKNTVGNLLNRRKPVRGDR